MARRPRRMDGGADGAALLSNGQRVRTGSYLDNQLTIFSGRPIIRHFFCDPLNESAGKCRSTMEQCRRMTCCGARCGIKIMADVQSTIVTQTKRRRKTPTWPTSLRNVGQLGKILFNPRRQLRVNAALACTAPVPQARYDLRMRLKYLVEYASRALSTDQRYELLCSHYTYLQRHFQPQFLSVIFSSGLPIWRRAQTEEQFEITLDFPHGMQTEGDLRLTFSVNQHPVYRMIFTIGWGKTFLHSADHVILVTCVQGLAGAEQIRRVSDCCEQVHPSDLLMSALSGVARACGVRTVLGIMTSHQIANGSRFYFSYEKFFERYGAMNDSTQLFEIPIPFEHKDLSEVQAKHRSRTRKKRAFREDVATDSGMATATQRVAANDADNWPAQAARS